MKRAYSARYFPVAPVLEVTVRSAETGNSIGPLTALVDTGTDVTTVPLSIVNALQAPLARQALVEAHWGARLLVSLFTIDVHIDAWTMPSVDVIADPRGAEIILGRDILNKLWLKLDGPAQTVEVANRRPRRR